MYTRTFSLYVYNSQDLSNICKHYDLSFPNARGLYMCVIITRFVHIIGFVNYVLYSLYCFTSKEGCISFCLNTIVLILRDCYALFFFFSMQ